MDEVHKVNYMASIGMKAVREPEKILLKPIEPEQKTDPFRPNKHPKDFIYGLFVGMGVMILFVILVKWTSA
jgi:hypothetical protein